MAKQKQVLIDQSLFAELVKYHCIGVKDDVAMNERIAAQLEAKLDKVCSHIEYTSTLTKKTPV